MKTYNPPIEGRRSYKGVLCDFNERTTPVSSAVRLALRVFVKKNQLQVYPEYGDELQRQIAAYARVPAEQVMITNGSDQGIDLIFRTFTGASDTVCIPSPSFAMFYQCAGIMGNKILEPAYELPNLAYPMNTVMNAVGKGAKLVIICNPNNPTGTLLPLKDIEQIVKKAAGKKCMVYIDEAYYEFSQVTAAPLVKKYPNLIITRTFSKAFGLAALRIGYVLSQKQNISEMQKVLGPYDINMPACRAASAALNDVASTRAYASEVMTRAKRLIEDFFRKQKITFYPSGANFILFKPNNVQKTYNTLREAGILTRPRSGQNIEGTLRLSIGTVAQMKKFIRIFRKKILKKIAFVDRDGALLFEPQDTFQIDSIAKLRILPGVIKGLKKLIQRGYELVMISNQDGLGTKSFPEKNFLAPQNRMLNIFRKNGIIFSKIFICPHFKEDNCACRKPKTGLVDAFMKTFEIDRQKSFMYGDRETDGAFAQNLGIQFIKTPPNGTFL